MGRDLCSAIYYNIIIIIIIITIFVELWELWELSGGLYLVRSLVPPQLNPDAWVQWTPLVKPRGVECFTCLELVVDETTVSSLCNARMSLSSICVLVPRYCLISGR